MPARGRCLIVIRITARARAEQLRERYGAEAEVILDRRRQTDRRATPRWTAIERREQERRRPLRGVERDLWTSFGVRLVREAREEHGS